MMRKKKILPKWTHILYENLQYVHPQLLPVYIPHIQREREREEEEASNI